MQLLDRGQDLRALQSSLRDAIDCHGRVALVSGEAGIGKTSLIRAFLSGLDPDIRVMRCACEDLGIAEPLGPLRDLLSEAARQNASAPAQYDGPRQTFEQVLLLCAQHRGCTVLIVEDFHWADDGTVDFVRYFARRIEDLSVLLIVSARDEEAKGRKLVRRALGDISTEILRRVSLATLSETAVAHLCRDTGQDPHDIYHASGGNAFFVAELLRNKEQQLPESIRDTVLARVDKLDPDAQTVLSAASIVPRRAGFEDVLVAVPDINDFEKAIERCLDAGLLVTDGDGLSFTHELARQAVLSSLSAIRKKTFHGRLFRHHSSLEDLGLARLLHHAQEAGEVAAVADIAPRAARAAAKIGSWREAAAFYATAVEATQDNCEPVVLEEAAWSSYVAGEHARAAGYQERAILTIDASTEAVRKGDALRKLSRYRWIRSDYEGAFEAVENAITLLSEHRGPELAQAYSSLSQLMMTGYRFDEVDAPARKAIALAKEFDRPDIISHALNNLGMSFTHSDADRARALLSESLEIGKTLDEPDHVARALGNWMHLEFHTCEYRNALHQAELSANFSRDHEMDAYFRYAVGMIARSKHQLGNWGEVPTLAAKVFDPEDRVPENYNFNGAITLLLHQVRTGDPIDSNVMEYLDLYDRPDAEPQRIGFIAEIKAEHAWLTRESVGSAVDRLHMVASNARHPNSIGGTYLWLKRLGQEVDTAIVSGFAEPYRLEIQGDMVAAARAWADRGAPYEQAMALAFASSAHLEKSLEIFRGLGAGPALVRLGVPADKPRGQRGRPATTGPEGLTTRQLHVLALLGEGLTNAQIGEKLFISPKTVDHHVSAILEKLEVASRGKAAAKARNLGLI